MTLLESMRTINSDIRKSGISLIGDLSWGTHICVLYQTEKDLLDVLVPYLKTGLKNNEYCLWIASGPLDAHETVRKAMKKAALNFKEYVKKKRVEIISNSSQFTDKGEFGKIVNMKLDKAVTAGFDGLRLVVNVLPEMKGKRVFIREEADLFGKHNVIGVFAYPRDAFDALGLIEVAKHHRFALVNNEGNWEIIESSEAWIAKDALRRAEEKLYTIFNNMSEGFAYHKIVVDAKGKPCDYIFLEINKSFERLTGLDGNKIIGMRVTDVLPGIEKDPVDWIGKYGKVAMSGKPIQFESYSQALDKWYFVSVYSPRKGYFAVMFTDISERKRAEVALKESEQRWVTTLGSIGDAVIATDLKGKIVFMNNIAETLTGWTLSEASQKSAEKVFNIINERTRKKVDNPVFKVLKKGMIMGLANHTILVKKDGTEIPVDDSGAPIRDEEGKIMGVVLVFRDISERKEAERQIEHLALFPKENPNPTLEVNASGKITFANQAVQKVLKDLHLREEDAKLFVPEDLIAVLKNRNKKNRRVISRLVTIKDRIFGETIYFTPRLDYARIYASDVTERKKIEEKNQQLDKAVRQEKDRLSSLVNSMQDEVWFADTEKKFILANPSALHEFVFNKSSKDIDVERLARNLEVYRPDGSPRPVDEAPPLRALKGEMVKNQEEMIRTPVGGELRYREVSASPVKDADNNIIGSISIVRDITARKETEQALKKSIERLAIISDTASQLLLSQEPQRIVESLCQKVMKYLDCHVFFNFLVDDERNCLRLNAYAGIPEETAREIHFLDFGVAVCGCAARDACRIIAENIPTTPDIRTDLVRSFGIKAYACHPLFSQGRVIGTLSFGTRSHLTFTEDELSLMKTVADLVATAMERIRLFQTVEARADELERRVQERTLELSRQAELLDLAHDAIILRDINGTISFWSVGAERTYGWRKEEAIGKMTHDLLHTVSPLELQTIMDIANREGSWEGELLHTGKNGNIITALSRWAIRQDETGIPAQIMEVNRDISERKRNEKAILLAGAYNRSLIEASLDPLVTIDPSGKITDVNITTEKVTGFSREELIGTDFSNYFTEPDKAEAGYQRAFSEGLVQNYPLELLHKNGHCTPVLYNAAVYHDDTGKIIGVFAAARDITERKQAEDEIHRISTYNRSLIEASLDPLVTIDSNGKISDVNSATEHITGYPRDNLIGTDFSDYFTDPDKARDGYRLVFQKEIVRDYELEILHRDGHVTPVLYNASVYRDESDKVLGVFAAARDITEKVKLEKEFRQSQKMQAIGTLAGGIAHDFNNIIAGIIGFTEMALDDASPEDPTRRKLELVLKGAYRGRDLVKQILTFSRRNEQDKKPVSMRSTLKDVLPLIRASLPSTVEIRNHIHAQNDTILADQTQIQQIIINLCSNAAYAMREKGGVLEFFLSEEDISFRAQNVSGESKPGKYIKLTVSDTGCGIKPEHLELLFDPFFTTKAPGEGTGLGLSMVHGIIKSHDGFITVSSMLGKGTSFTVYIPMIDQEVTYEAGDEKDLKGGAESVLIVDDEDLLVEMGKQRLERLGYKVTGASSGAEAIKLFGRAPHSYDLVITDYTMPYMTGLDLAKKLLRIRPDIPVILYSGLNEHIPLDEVKEAGIKEFFAKPISKDEFARVIRRVLDKEISKGRR